MFVTKFKNICLKIHCTCALDLALKSLLFALLFYVVSSPVIYDYLNRNLPKGLEVLAIQSVMFALSFYLINLYL